MFIKFLRNNLVGIEWAYNGSPWNMTVVSSHQKHFAFKLSPDDGTEDIELTGDVVCDMDGNFFKLVCSDDAAYWTMYLGMSPKKPRKNTDGKEVVAVMKLYGANILFGLYHVVKPNQ
jgi:hypothetical protein